MTLDEFIQRLQQELNIQSLTPTRQGYSLLFDDSLAVNLFSARGEMIYISAVPALSDNEYQQEQQLKQAMGWSLAWKGGNTSLALVDHQAVVQTHLSINKDFPDLREALNAHCQFVEQLEQLEFQSVQQVYQDVFIRP